MLALYICVGTGVLVWLWLVWDMAREGRAKRGSEPSRASAEVAEDAPPKPAPKARPKAKAKPKPGQRRPLGKVTYNRPKRRPPEPEPEPEPEPPPKPPRDPRDWMAD